MLLQFEKLSAFQNLTHAVTRAHFKEMENFNLADHVGSGSLHAIENRKILATHLKLPFTRMTAAQQVHGNTVTIINESLTGKGHDGWKSAIPATDAMITNLKNTPLMVFSADCPLILVYDKKIEAIGLIHASWRSTFSEIITRTIKAMSDNFKCKPENIIAGIGPGAGPCCYEIDEKFVQTIRTKPELSDFVINRNSKLFFDLWSATKSELIRSGISSENIESMSRCTICDKNFFSFRRQKDLAGRFSLIASL